MNSIITTIFIFSFPLLIHSQKLTCKDFKKGNFIALASDSDGKMNKSYIMRKIDSQIEYSKENDSIYVNIRWISDCSFKLNYDSTKMSLDKMQQWTHKNDGILIKMTTQEGKCMNYQAIMTTSNGGEIGTKGKICIE